MLLLLASVGRLKDGPERVLVARYAERARGLGRGLGLAGPDIAEVAESRAPRAADRKTEEAQGLRGLASRAAGRAAPVLVALEEGGEALDSAGFARLIAARRDAGTAAMAFLIGGADGLDPTLAGEAALRLGFGRMTLPHQLVRVLVAEQLYRAMTILAGHPYHRA